MIRGRAMDLSPVQSILFVLLTRNKLFSEAKEQAYFFSPYNPNFLPVFVNELFILYSLLDKLFFHHFLLSTKT